MTTPPSAGTALNTSLGGGGGSATGTATSTSVVAAVAGSRSEFQAIIMAGGVGNRVYPLTSGDLPKALLPVANRPLISYQLELLEKSGFTDVIIVAHESGVAAIRKYVLESYRPKLAVDFVALKEHSGTAEAIYNMREKIRTDFIVISCDLIADPRFLHHMADVHRTSGATVTVLFKEPPPPDPSGGSTASSSSSKDAPDMTDFVGLDEKRQRLLFFSAAADLDDSLRLSKSMLKRHPNITIYNNLVDAHFYIFSRYIIDLLEYHRGDGPASGAAAAGTTAGATASSTGSGSSSATGSPLIAASAGATGGSDGASATTASTNGASASSGGGGSSGGSGSGGGAPAAAATVTTTSAGGAARTHKKTITSLKGDLLPYLLKCQSHPSLQRELPERRYAAQLALTMSSGTSLQYAAQTQGTKVQCLAYVMDGAAYCLRANTIPAYMQANREIATGHYSYRPNERVGRANFIHETATIERTTQVGAECVVGAAARIGDRVSVKKSMIGAGCVIGNRVKLNNAVLMDGVTVGDDCTISNSIISPGVRIGEKSVLEKSAVTVSVPAESEIKNDTVTKERE